MSGLKRGQWVGFIRPRAGVETEKFPGRENELDKGQQLERRGGVERGWRERDRGSVWAAEDSGSGEHLPMRRRGLTVAQTHAVIRSLP